MLRIFIQELFYVLTISLIIFSLLEMILPGMVLAYININWLLIFWLINVIFLLVFKNEKAR